MLNRIIPPLMILCCLIPTHSNAAVFELEDGKKIEGEIITKEGDQYYIETKDGLINLTAMEIYKIDGKLHQIEGLVSEEEIAEEKEKLLNASNKSQRKKRYSARYRIPKVDVSNLAARVEQGGITHDEFHSYLHEVASVAGQKLEYMVENTRKQVLDIAIEHEMLLEKALDANLHTEPIIKERIVGEYLSAKVRSNLTEKSVSEETYQKFHQENQDLFLEDPLVLYSSHVIPQNWTSSKSSRRRYLEKVKSDPSQVKDWKSSGWIRPHRNCVASGPAVQLHCDEIFKMKKGEFRGFESGWGNTIVWMKDRKGEEPIPYKRLKKKHILNEMKKAEQKEAYQELMKELNATSEEALFTAALEEKYYRKLPIRQHLMFRLIAKNKTSYEKMINTLRPQADFKIIVQDFMAISGKPALEERFISKYWHPYTTEFDPETGEFSSAEILKTKGEDLFWSSVWAPSGELLFEAPKKMLGSSKSLQTEKKDIPKKKLSKKEVEKRERLQQTPLAEEIDHVAAIQAQHEKALNKAKNQPSKIKSTMITVYIICAVLLIGLIIWVLSRF